MMLLLLLILGTAAELQTELASAHGGPAIHVDAKVEGEESRVSGWYAVLGLCLLVAARLVHEGGKRSALIRLQTKKAFEGMEALALPLSVDSISVSPHSLTLRLHNLWIANPSGYNSPYLLHASEVLLSLDMLSLLLGPGPTLDADKLEVRGLRVFLEARWNTSNVLEALAIVTRARVAVDGQRLTLHKVHVQGQTEPVQGQMEPVGKSGAESATQSMPFSLTIDDFEHEVFGEEAWDRVARCVLACVLREAARAKISFHEDDTSSQEDCCYSARPIMPRTSGGWLVGWFL